MSTEPTREDLKKIIFDSHRNNTQIDLQDDRRLKGSQLAWAGFAADALLAAGYRKPRAITTVEELDSLPVGSILRDSAGKPWHIFMNDEGFRIHRGADFTQFPAAVLYEPEAQATR